jgi:hypothetical protein
MSRQVDFGVWYGLIWVVDVYFQLFFFLLIILLYARKWGLGLGRGDCGGLYSMVEMMKAMMLLLYRVRRFVATPLLLDVMWAWAMGMLFWSIRNKLLSSWLLENIRAFHTLPSGICRLNAMTTVSFTRRGAELLFTGYPGSIVLRVL